MAGGYATAVGMDEERLSDKQYITVILRLVVDAHGQLVLGEAVEVQSQRAGRFRNWPALIRTIQHLLKPSAPDESAHGH